MWIYLICAMVARQAEFLVQIISDFHSPSSKEYPKPNENQALVIIFLIIYAVMVSVLPIFILSYLADKPLLWEK